MLGSRFVMKGGGRVLHIWWVRFGSVLSVLAVLLGIVVGVEPRAGAKRPKVYVNDQATRLWDEETGEIGEVHADSDTGGQESWRKKSQEIDLRYGEQVIDITQRITEDALSWLTYPTDDASVRQIAEAVTRGKDFIILRSIMGHGRYSPKETNWLDGKLFEFGRKSALLYRREIGAAPDKVFIHYPSAAIPGLMLAEDWNGDGAEVATGGVWHSSAVLKALMIMEDLLGAVLEQEPEALQEPETTLRFKNALMATLEGFHFPPRIEAEARYALARLGFMGVNSKLELDAIRASTPLAERAYNEGRFHFVHPGTDIGRDFYPATVPETDEDRAVYERFKVRAATLDRPNAPFLLLAARPDPVKGMAGLLERVIVARKAGKQIPNIALILPDPPADEDESPQAREHRKIRRLVANELAGVATVLPRMPQRELGGLARSLVRHHSGSVFGAPAMFGGFELMPNEMKACGLPVVSSTRIGAVEVLNSEYDRMFDPRDERFVDAIIEVSQMSAERYRKASCQAIEDTKDIPTWADNVGKYNQLFEKHRGEKVIPDDGAWRWPSILEEEDPQKARAIEEHVLETYVDAFIGAAQEGRSRDDREQFELILSQHVDRSRAKGKRGNGKHAEREVMAGVVTSLHENGATKPARESILASHGPRDREGRRLSSGHVRRGGDPRNGRR